MRNTPRCKNTCARRATWCGALVAYARCDGRAGSGKSGGVRICYYARTRRGQILMLVIYAKSTRDALPSHVLKALREELEDGID